MIEIPIVSRSRLLLDSFRFVKDGEKIWNEICFLPLPFCIPPRRGVEFLRKIQDDRVARAGNESIIPLFFRESDSFFARSSRHSRSANWKIGKEDENLPRTVKFRARNQTIRDSIIFFCATCETFARVD